MLFVCHVNKIFPSKFVSVLFSVNNRLELRTSIYMLFPLYINQKIFQLF